MNEPQSLSVVIGRPSATPTPGLELFPDPAEVVADWSKALAARVVPVLAFDLDRVDASLRGRGVIVVWDDPAFSFLDLQVVEGRARLPDLAALRPLDEPFDRLAAREKVGVGLELERIELALEPPETMPDWSWQTRFGEALDEATEELFPLNLIRFDTYPCFIQNLGCVLEAFRYLCELPREALGVGAGTFYVSGGAEGELNIELQLS